MFDVVYLALPVLGADERLHHRQDVFLAERGDGVLNVEVEAHVQFDASDGRQVVALRIEEPAGEQSVGGLAGPRLAGANDAIDCGKGLLVRTSVAWVQSLSVA